MKKSLLFLCYSAFLLFSCTSELDYSSSTHAKEKRTMETDPLRNIKDYIANVKFGGKSSRSINGEYTLSPYIYKGDTCSQLPKWRLGTAIYGL